MYAGPFVAAWEKIVDIRSILRGDCPKTRLR